MRGLVNSAEFFDLPDGTRVEIGDVHVASSTRPPDVEIVARHGDDVVWRADLPGFDPDVTSAAVDINTVDYKAVHWRAGGYLVVAGETRAHLIRVVDGQKRAELELAMTGVSTVDFLAVVELSGLPLVAICCPKVVWLVDDHARVVGEHRFAGPITAVRERLPGELAVTVHDVENDSLPEVDHVIDCRLPVHPK